MTSPESQLQPAEVFQSLIYNGNYHPDQADVLLLLSESGSYSLPESRIDPRLDEQGFIDDIEAITGLKTEPFTDSTEESMSTHWPKGAEAHKIILPYQRATHYLLSRVVSGELSTNSPYASAEWIDIRDLPEPARIDPFSLVSLSRFQFSWALANTA